MGLSYQKKMKGDLKHAPRSHASLETIFDLHVFTSQFLSLSNTVQNHYIKLPSISFPIHRPSTVMFSENLIMQSSVNLCCGRFLNHNIIYFLTVIAILNWNSSFFRFLCFRLSGCAYNFFFYFNFFKNLVAKQKGRFQELHRISGCFIPFA